MVRHVDMHVCMLVLVCVHAMCCARIMYVCARVCPMFVWVGVACYECMYVCCYCGVSWHVMLYGVYVY